MEGISFGRYLRQYLYVLLIGKHLLSNKEMNVNCKGKINKFYSIKIKNFGLGSIKLGKHEREKGKVSATCNWQRTFIRIYNK